MPRLIRRVFSETRRRAQIDGHQRPRHRRSQNQRRESRVGIGEVGYTIEFGRPGVGVRFRDIQEMTRALAKLDIVFEAKNPISHLMTDKSSGTLRADILDEKILFRDRRDFAARLDRVEAVCETVSAVNERIDTVTAVGISNPLRRAGRRQVARAVAGRSRLRLRTRQNQHGHRPGHQHANKRKPHDQHAAPLRQGASFDDDYIVFCIPSPGRNDEGAVEKQKQFLRICARHDPANMGNGNRGSFKPERRLNPTAHWRRGARPRLGRRHRRGQEARHGRPLSSIPRKGRSLPARPSSRADLRTLGQHQRLGRGRARSRRMLRHPPP